MNATIKQIQEIVGTAADGIWGGKTQAAVAAKLGCAATSKSIQEAVGAKADGIIGPKTYAAILAKLGGKAPAQSKPADPDAAALSKITQASIRSGKSIFGKAGDESNMVFVKPPYTIYYDGKPYKHGVKVHKALAKSLEKIFAEVLEAYGADKIHELHMDDYAGGYTYKKTAGGNSMSIHSWGCAIDWWPAKNLYATKSPKAGFSAPAYNKWWEIWERNGWHSLGRERNYDWMHVQIGAL